MRPYTFTVRGHPNILATHPTTLEFTAHTELTPRGDCIVGVGANFDVSRLREFMSCARICITIRTAQHADELTATPNSAFNDQEEIVVRLGAFSSSRTLATDANKAAKHLSRALVLDLQDPACTATIEVTCDGR